MVLVKVEVDEETILNSVKPEDAVAIYGVDKLLDIMDKSEIADYFKKKSYNLLSEMSAEDVINLLGVANVLSNIDLEEIIKFYGAEAVEETVKAIKDKQTQMALEAMKKSQKK